MVRFNNESAIKANDVADLFLSLSEPGTPLSITPLKLQKLLYYAQGWHMALKEESLFKDDFKAWEHGPVIPDIYHKYKYKGYSTIPRIDFKNKNDIFTTDQIQLLNAVWKTYGNFDGKYLEQLTHQEKPWLSTNQNEIIKQEEIKNYFNEMANQKRR